VDDDHHPCRKHVLEMRPIKYVLSGGLLFLFNLQLLHLSLQVSGIISGGSPAQSHKEGINSEPMEWTSFQVVSLLL
jgi:hypothetical protein